jgi:LysR family transcriptional regulator for metE and metH
MPRWLIEEWADRFAVVPVRLGKDGIDKQIHLGIREADADTDYLRAFLNLAREHRDAVGRGRNAVG